MSENRLGGEPDERVLNPTPGAAADRPTAAQLEQAREALRWADGEGCPVSCSRDHLRHALAEVDALRAEVERLTNNAIGDREAARLSAQHLLAARDAWREYAGALEAAPGSRHVVGYSYVGDSETERLRAMAVADKAHSAAWSRLDAARAALEKLGEVVP